MIHPDLKMNIVGHVWLDDIGRCKVGVYSEEGVDVPHFHIISEQNDFDAAVQLTKAEYYHTDKTDVLNDKQLEQLNLFLTSMTEHYEFKYESVYNDMVKYEKKIWNIIPHFIISKRKSIDGQHVILYPNMLNAVLQGIDDIMFDRAKVIANDIVVYPHFHTPEQETTKQALVMILTDDPENAKKAIYEIHSLLFMLGETFAFPHWLRMCSMFRDKRIETDEDYDNMFNVVFENHQFKPREELIKEMDAGDDNSFVAFTGTL